MSNEQAFKQLQKKLNTDKFWSLNFTYYKELNTVELEVIIIDDKHRNKGYAKLAIQEICNLCDELNVVFVLYPSSEFGTPKTFLHRFYRKFGFRYLADRNKDYTDRYKNFMKRFPEKKQ
jgi:GNAT superfamily N-acetyltransferase